MLRISTGCLLGSCVLLSILEEQLPCYLLPWRSDEYTIVERD